jgi:hypothetical protein
VIAASVVVYLIWRLALVLLVVGVIVGYIWGGSNNAQERCLAHRLGAPGLLNSLACVFEH